MDPERKSRWGEPSSSDATKTEEEISAAATQAAAIAAKIAASLRPGVVGNELVRREQDEGFVKDIEVNDLRNRYVLTKASTQKQVSERECSPFSNGTRPRQIGAMRNGHETESGSGSGRGSGQEKMVSLTR
jgi:hypothetical protein